MRRLNWLSSEMSKWEADGLLTQEQREQIENYYVAEEEHWHSKFRNKALFSKAIGLLGVLFVMLGVVFMFVPGIYDMPKSGQAVLVFLPILAGQVLGYKTLKNERSAWWAEISSALMILGLVGLFNFVASTYGFSKHINSALILVFIMFPMCYFFNSIVAFVGYMGNLVLYAMNTTNPDLSANIATILALFILIIPFVFERIASDREGIKTGIFTLVVALSGFMCSLTIGNWGGVAMPVITTYFALSACLDIWLYEDSMPLRRRPFALVGHFGMYTLMCMFTFGTYWNALKEEPFEINKCAMFLVFLFAACIVIGIKILNECKEEWAFDVRDVGNVSFDKVLYQLFGGIENVRTKKVLQVMAVPTLAIVFHLLKWSTFPFIVFNFIFAVTSAYILFSGIKRSSITKTNQGLILLGVLFVFRIVDWGLGMIERGFLFILAGFVFIGCNMLVVNNKRRVG